jgi:hypothetical protein
VLISSVEEAIELISDRANVRFVCLEPVSITSLKVGSLKRLKRRRDRDRRDRDRQASVEVGCARSRE